jgi:CPA2 family monovalent cation:H+ antiporter-2
MISEGEMLFQLGAVMLLAFVGAVLASKARQSVMIGYIIIGIFLGPYIHLSVFGFDYNGIVTDMTLINAMSQIGLILLLFFIGLDFSVGRLTRTKTPAFILAFVNISLSMFMGFVVGQIFGWPLIDTFFLAGVMAMNSTAIAAKSLIELKRTSNPESELIMAFEVIGTFVAMLILMVISGVVSTGARRPDNIPMMIIGIGAFFAFFAFLSIFLVPRIIPMFEKIQSDEMFVLFSLGMVFMVAAIAEVSFVPPIIGAFFIGTVFADSKLAKRLESKLMSFKDAFVAIFFISFGMMIDPANFQLIIPLLIVAVPLVLLSDVLITPILTYFMGYSSKASTAIGTAINGRAEESILFASLGSKVQVQGASKGGELMPFAGVFCFIMSALTPALMRRSSKIAAFFSWVIPRRIVFGSSLISRTLSKTILPSSFPMFKRAKKTGFTLVAFFITIVAILATNDLYFVMATIAGVAIASLFYIYCKREINEIVRQANYSNLGLPDFMPKAPITSMVSKIIGCAIFAILLVAVIWRFYWFLSPMVLIGYLVACIVMIRGAAIKLAGPAPQMGDVLLPRRRLVSKDREGIPAVSEHAALLNRMAAHDLKCRSRMLRRSLEEREARL